MASGQNRPESEITRRVDAVRSSSKTAFRDLLRDGAFDITRELRFQNLSGLSFSGEDLRGIDFTGANLCHCDFTGALIAGARFDQARLGSLVHGAVHLSSLLQASDWEDCKAGAGAGVDNVYYSELSGERYDAYIATDGDWHLPDWSIFQDSVLLPLMVVLPGRKHRNAISLLPLQRYELLMFRASYEGALEIKHYNGLPHGGHKEMDHFTTWASAAASRHYHECPASAYRDELGMLDAALAAGGTEIMRSWTDALERRVTPQLLKDHDDLYVHLKLDPIEPGARVGRGMRP